MGLFIGFDVTDEVDEELSSLQKYLNPGYKSKTHFHVTLKFLGEVDEKDIPKIKETLSQIHYKKFTLRLNGFGVFQDENIIKILWVGIEPHDDVRLLNAKIEEVLSDKFEKNNKFDPHITLLRLGHILDSGHFIENLKRLRVHPIEFEVTNINLYKSDLTGKNGQVYTILDKKDLS